MNQPPSHTDLPQIGEEQIQILERLSNASGVSGDEGPVRSIILEQVRAALENQPGEVKVDALGNVLVTRPGQGENRLRVMLAAHMDEVGLMIISEDDKDYFRFDTVGGIDTRQLPGKPVLIGRDLIPGLIGAKPIHLTRRDETKSAIQLDSMRIDAGSNKGKVNVGDRVAFATRFKRQGPSLIGKALDNRLGVAILLELVKNPPANVDLLAAFTVQEEVGLRGARVAAYAFDPDLAFAIDSTPAFDLPCYDKDEAKPCENRVYNTRLGEGPAIYILDSGTISDPRLVRHLKTVAEQRAIPYQMRQPGGGGTDAGAIHRQRSGIPSASISVPSRYPHTAVSVAYLSDWQNTLALVHAALQALTSDVLSEER